MGEFRRRVRNCTWPLPAAELDRRGVTRGVLAGTKWVRTSRGFYRPSTDEPITTVQRLVDAAAVVPEGAALAGWAAAYVHGADRLDGRDDHTLRPLPVPVLLPMGLHRRSVPGVRYLQAERTVRVESVAGVPVTPPADTLVDLARWSQDLAEAVVAVDAVLSAQLVRWQQLADTRVRGPGSRQAARVVELSRPGVRSNWESRLRMFWVLTMRLPSPLVNRPVFDLEGNFLGAPDLLDEEAGLAMEYDGTAWRSTTTAGHRDAAQHRRDNHREERFERTGLIVVRVDKVDLTRQRRLLAARLRGARGDGLSRDRSRDRWTLQEPPGWLGLPA